MNAVSIDTGDTVLHGPTGEQWLVAYVRDDRLAWVGWPEGEAQLADCTLLTKATPEERRRLLHEMAASKSGRRSRYAAYTLAEEARTDA